MLYKLKPFKKEERKKARGGIMGGGSVLVTAATHFKQETVSAVLEYRVVHPPLPLNPKHLPVFYLIENIALRSVEGGGYLSK